MYILRNNNKKSIKVKTIELLGDIKSVILTRLQHYM